MRIWERMGIMDTSLGAPAAAGSLIACKGCRGRGWNEALPPLDWGGDAETGAADTCSLCGGRGQFAFPLSRLMYRHLEGRGELPSPYDEEPPAVHARASPRRSGRAKEAA